MHTRGSYTPTEHLTRGTAGRRERNGKSRQYVVNRQGTGSFVRRNRRKVVVTLSSASLLHWPDGENERGEAFNDEE